MPPLKKLIVPAAAAAVAGGIIFFTMFRAGEAIPRVDTSRTFPPGGNPVRSKDSSVVRFGFEAREEVTDEIDTHEPFLRYLERKVGRPFELRFARKGEDLVDNLGLGRIDFAMSSPPAYVIARKRLDIVPLARETGPGEMGEYRSAVVTRPDSPIRTIEDLRGKTFAFGARYSTRQHIIPLIMLAEGGVRPEDLKSFSFGGDSSRAVELTISGAADAAGISVSRALNLAEQGIVRIIDVSRLHPGRVILAGGGVDPGLVAEVKKALLSMEPSRRDGDDLNPQDASPGYLHTDPSEYDGYEKIMTRLGPLAPGNPAP